MPRYTGAAYMRLIRKRVRSKVGSTAWKRASRQASVYRKRLIAANPGCKYDAKTGKLLKTSLGKKAARRFGQFWKVKCIPSIRMIPSPGKKVVPLVGMGFSKTAHVSSGDKGARGAKKRVVSGHWTVACDHSGKRVLLLTERPTDGRWKEIGWCPETNYTPPPDVEAAGTHKKGFQWRHLHGVDDEKKGIPASRLHFPRMYADRNGKVDAKSNFLCVLKGPAKITTWMFGN